MIGTLFALVLWYNHGSALIGYYETREACVRAGQTTSWHLRGRQEGDLGTFNFSWSPVERPAPDVPNKR
jgi:hypothetical protein